MRAILEVMLIIHLNYKVCQYMEKGVSILEQVVLTKIHFNNSKKAFTNKSPA